MYVYCIVYTGRDAKKGLHAQLVFVEMCIQFVMYSVFITLVYTVQYTTNCTVPVHCTVLNQHFPIGYQYTYVASPHHVKTQKKIYSTYIMNSKQCVCTSVGWEEFH